MLAGSGCTNEASDPEYIARVGENYLMHADVRRALANLPVPQDSTDARQQIIEQWVTNELLFQEASRRGLRSDPEVQRLLEDSERSVLVNALIARMYEENEATPSTADMQAYYEAHKEQLRLRENFVHVRYLEASTEAEASEARAALLGAEASVRDSVWSQMISRFAVDPSSAAELSSDYYPERRLFAMQAPLHDALAALDVGQTAPVISSDSTFHVLQLVDRLPPGTIPQMSWIEDELVRRLTIQGRKQLYSRQVQRLRNEALAREDLEVK